MSDELVQVVRDLYAERYRRSQWWATEKDRQAQRRQELEAALIAVEKDKRKAAE